MVKGKVTLLESKILLRLSKKPFMFMKEKENKNEQCYEYLSPSSIYEILESQNFNKIYCTVRNHNL